MAWLIWQPMLWGAIMEVEHQRKQKIALSLKYQ
jgi:hypothetical protein